MSKRENSILEVGGGSKNFHFPTVGNMFPNFKVKPKALNNASVL